MLLPVFFDALKVSFLSTYKIYAILNCCKIVPFLMLPDFCDYINSLAQDNSLYQFFTIFTQETKVTKKIQLSRCEWFNK